MNSLPRLLPDCDLNPGHSAPESSTLTTRLPSHPCAKTAELIEMLPCGKWTGVGPGRHVLDRGPESLFWVQSSRWHQG